MNLARLTAAALTAALATGLTTDPAALAARAPGSGPELIGNVWTSRWFSPDRDGVQDDLRVQVVLFRDADVSVVVRRGATRSVVRRAHLGDLTADTVRRWRWDGRNDAGRAVRDGSYTLTVVATRTTGTRTTRDRTVTDVGLRRAYTENRTAKKASTFQLSRNTLHPSTPGLVDRIYVAAINPRFVRVAPNPAARQLQGAAWYVADADGHRVRTWPETRDASPRAWDGTDASGEPVPAGSYTVVMVKQDNYGNRKRLRRPVTVSAEPMVARPWSVTIPADTAMLEHDARSGRDGWTTCPPKPSPRMAGGITVLSQSAAAAYYGTRCDDAQGRFNLTTPFAMDPVDQVSITATGGAVPSASAEGIRLVSYPVTEASSAPGVARTTLGPFNPLAVWWHDPDRTRVEWAVSSRDLTTTEYDVASFDVEVVHYAPQS